MLTERGVSVGGTERHGVPVWSDGKNRRDLAGTLGFLSLLGGASGEGRRQRRVWHNRIWRWSSNAAFAAVGGCHHDRDELLLTSLCVGTPTFCPVCVAVDSFWIRRDIPLTSLRETICSAPLPRMRGLAQPRGSNKHVRSVYVVFNGKEELERA